MLRTEPGPGEIKKQALSLMSAENISADHIKLVSELMVLDSHAARQWQIKAIYPRLTGAEIARRLRGGQPAIDAAEITAGEGELLTLLGKIIPVMDQYARPGSLGAVRLAAAAQNGQTSLSGLVRAIAAGDEKYVASLAAALGIAPAELIFLGIELARPLMHRISRAAAAKYPPLKDCTGDSCPVCGWAPRIACFRPDDGKRQVECSLCGAQWSVPRLRCLECGNENEATLGYLYIDGRETRRIDKCELCQAYIKTVDERKMGEETRLALRLEDAATLYLDILAEKRGYHHLG